MGGLPSPISFLADQDDFKTILAYLSDHAEIAFIVAVGPSRWQAVSRLDRLETEWTALWHVPSGPLPLLQADFRKPDGRIGNPWSGWTELRAGADRSRPYFGPAHPSVIWLQYIPEAPGTRHGVGISLFEWVGNYDAVIGRSAAPVAEEFWQDLRRWVTRQTVRRGSPGDSRAFPSAMARIRAATDPPVLRSTQNA